MVTVLCVKHGQLYDDSWVLKLRSMVRRNLGALEFICLTDQPVDGVRCVPLQGDLAGWWAKLQLFRPGAFAGDNLYLDLDLVVTASLGPLVALLERDRSKLWARDDFSYSLKNPKGGLGREMLAKLGGPGCVNSSVMLWHGDACRRVWDEFDPKCMDVLHGDQNWISQCLWPDINLIPDDMICSYKYHVQRGARVAPICVFHGNPKNHQVSDSFVKEHWR